MQFCKTIENCLISENRSLWLRAAAKPLKLLSCSKVYLRNENLSIYSIHSTKYVMHVGSLVDVTTLGLNHSLYSSRHAFIQWFEVRWCALLQAFESNFFETRSQPSFFLTLQLFCLQPQWLNQIESGRIFRPSWEE